MGHSVCVCVCVCVCVRAHTPVRACTSIQAALPVCFMSVKDVCHSLGPDIFLLPGVKLPGKLILKQKLYLWELL